MIKRLLKLGFLVAIASVFVVSLIGLPANAARSDVTPMIVGGNNAVEQYGAVSLWYPDRPRCAASLINQYWALTSAHCQNVLVVGQTEIRASSLHNNNGTHEPNIRLADFYIHPNYNANNLTNDIALIKFDKPVKHTVPLTITTQSPAINTLGKIAGWGWICEDISNPNCGRTVNVLQELNVKIVADSKCGYLFDPQNQLCMTASNGTNAMACYGDSGGPLVRKSANKWLLIGMTSHDGDFNIDHPNPCASNDTGGQGSGVAVDVSRYTSWIFQTMINN